MEDMAAPILEPAQTRQSFKHAHILVVFKLDANKLDGWPPRNANCPQSKGGKKNSVESSLRPAQARMLTLDHSDSACGWTGQASEGVPLCRAAGVVIGLPETSICQGGQVCQVCQVVPVRMTLWCSRLPSMNCSWLCVCLMVPQLSDCRSLNGLFHRDRCTASGVEVLNSESGLTVQLVQAWLARH